MSIPFNFDAIPQYFRKNGWLDPKKNGSHLKMYFFIGWCFSRCSSKNKAVFHDHKEIMLEPFEFIFGRRICSEETGLTEQEIRTMINQLNSGCFGEILKKSTSKTTSKFSVYTWSTDIFSQNYNQQNNQQVTSNQPATNHKQEGKILKSLDLIEKGALSAFAEKEPKVAILPAPCLPPIPNGMKELEEREVQVMFFNERVKGHGWVIPEESMHVWLKTYDIHYLIQTLELVVTRKNVKEPVRLFATAIRDDWLGEKHRKRENKAWIEGLKAKYKWPWVKITKAYVTIMTGSNESYYYEWVNFRMEITRILEAYGERTA